MKSPPAFQFYVDNFIEGTCDMTDAETGLYMRLLCAQWSRGGLPNDDEELMRFSRGATTLQLQRVKRKFEIGTDGLLRNARLEAERRKQAIWREKSAEGGRKSAESRAASKGGSRVVEPHIPNGSNQKPTLQSPSPSPSVPPAAVPPAGGDSASDEVEVEWESAKLWLADWKKNGADYTEFEARGAFLALQASGWMWGRNKVADPRAALERQIQTDRERKHGNNRTNGQSSAVNPRNDNANRNKAAEFRGHGQMGRVPDVQRPAA